LLILGLAAPALAAGNWKVVDRQFGRAIHGDEFAATAVGGSIDRPTRLRVVVTRFPRQRLAVDWSVFCSRSDYSLIPERKGRYRTYGGARELPVPPGAASCNVLVNAFSPRRGWGTVTALLWAKAR
jgi:hypothetical protein